jgi:hypothetical protein
MIASVELEMPAEQITHADGGASGAYVRTYVGKAG